MRKRRVRDGSKGRGHGGDVAVGVPAERIEPTTPTEVIRGVVLTVRGRELGVRLADHTRYHRERADIIIEELAKLAHVEHAAAADLVGVLGRYGSPRNLLEKRLREHQERVALLGFIRDHLEPDATYRLDSSDLKTIGLIPQNCY